MLILLLLLGVVFSSPVPLPTEEFLENKSPNGNSEPPTLLSHFEDSFTDGSPTSLSSSPSKIFSSELPTIPLEDRSIVPVSNGDSFNVEPPTSSNSNVNVAKLGSFSDQSYNPKLVSASHDQGDQTTQAERYVELQRERLPRNSLLPPLVFAQQSSDINLEPTEVEAPGTTPTTVSMILNPIVLVQRTFGSPPISVMEHEEDISQYDENDQEDAKDTDFIESSAETNYSKTFNPKVETKGSKSINKDSSLDESSFRNGKEPSNPIDLPLNDEAKVITAPVIKENQNNKRNGVFKIKTFNNTYMLVHEKITRPLMDQITAFSNENEKTRKGKNLKLDIPTVKEQSTNVKSNFTKDFQNADTPLSNKSSDARYRESKRIVTAAELLLNISRYRNSFRSDNPKFNNNDENTTVVSHHVTNDSNEEVITEPPTLDSDNVTELPVKEESEQGLKEKNDKRKIKENNSENADVKEENSNIETREVDNDSFFVLIESEISSKKIKKDDPELAKIEPKITDENGYRMDVITSSSEVTYKQFDPLKNITVPVMKFENNKNSNKSLEEGISRRTNFEYQKKEKSKTSEKVQKVTTYSPVFFTNITKQENVVKTVIANSVDANRENTSLLEQNVTSLPSQTSVVEPLRTNVSSSLSEVTSPSSESKSLRPERVVTNSDFFSDNIESDAVGRSPLEVSSEEEASPIVAAETGESQTTPIQQERVSIQVAEQVSSSISVGCVVAIVSGVLLSMVIVGGATAYFLYQRLEGFRPKILSSDRSCANSDSGGYLDDQCRVAYVNSQIDLPKSTPEDLVSLDNDSFLNSLESMTIQNLWTDNIRHTKL